MLLRLLLKVFVTVASTMSFLQAPEEPSQTPSQVFLDSLKQQADQLIAQVNSLYTSRQLEGQTLYRPTSSNQDGLPNDMAYPAEGQVFVPLYPTPEQPTRGLRQALNLWTRGHGYSVVIGRGRKYGNKRRRLLITCSKAGKPGMRVTPTTEAMVNLAKDQGCRKPMARQHSKKAECPFQFNLVEDKPGSNRFEVRYCLAGQPAHTHDPIDSWAEHSEARILEPNQQVKVDDQIRQGLTASEIIRGLFLDGIKHISAVDIHNRRQFLRTREQGGLSATNHLIQQLNEEETPASIESVDSQLSRLFVAPTSSLDLKGRNLPLVIMDTTFGTNLYNMFFVHVVCKFSRPNIDRLV